MKYVSSILLAGMMLMLAAQPVKADFSGVLPGLHTLVPLPVPPCPPAPWCDSLRNQILTYNQWVNTWNQLRNMRMQLQDQMRYPQSLPQYLKGDLVQLEKIADQNETLSPFATSIDKTIHDMWPDYNPGYDPVTLADKTDQIYEQTLIATLAGATKTNAATLRDLDAVEAIKAAAANATSPTAATQMVVQLNALLYNQMARQAQLEQLKISQEAAYDLTKAADERAARQQSEQARLAQLRQLIPVPPKLTKDQVDSIVQSWSGQQ